MKKNILKLEAVQRINSSSLYFIVEPVVVTYKNLNNLVSVDKDFFHGKYQLRPIKQTWTLQKSQGTAEKQPWLMLISFINWKKSLFSTNSY